MDRRLILAVAGSGKTTFLINAIDLERRFLVVTYTNNNLAHIRKNIINKYGYIPMNITLMSYFQFLIRVCYRPFLKDKYKAKGIYWDIPEESTRYRKDISHYMTPNRYLYHNRIAKLCLSLCANLIKERIEMFYDCFMVDEVQDLAGHDFNLIMKIIPQKIDCFFVGDFYQHTFDTSNDGNVKKGLYDNYEKYKSFWSKAGVTIDEASLSNSYRCTPEICSFVSQKLQITIASHRKDNSRICFIEKQEDADSLFYDNSKVKLFLQMADKYPCFAENWGRSKGLDDFHDVCIILNKTTLQKYKENALHTLSASTRNKLYVACTRAKGNIYFIPHIFIDRYKR